MANIKISELNELTEKGYDDYVPVVDTSANETKKIKVEELIKGVYLLAVTDTAPAECSVGDKYYNTTTNKIYRATDEDTWGTTGEDAVEGIMYVVFDTQTVYAYNGTTLVSVGGGAGGGDSTPIGTIQEYAGSTAPDGYLMCDGSAVSRTTYKDLFRVIGTSYGSGDGSTTFNLPNIKGKVVVMLDSNDTDFDTLGETGGSKFLEEHSHNLGGQAVALNGTHQRVDNTGITGGGMWGPATFGLNRSTTETAGTGDSGNLQPYIVLNKIIKVQKTAGEVLSEQLPVGTEVDFDGSASDIPIGWEEVDGKSLVAYTLYNGPATNDSITLSDSVENYSKILILYHNIVNLKNSVEISGNNSSIEFSTAYKETGTNTFYIVGCKGYASNKNITFTDFYTASNGAIIDTTNKYIYIDKVIGYKEV